MTADGYCGNAQDVDGVLDRGTDGRVTVRNRIVIGALLVANAGIMPVIDAGKGAGVDRVGIVTEAMRRATAH